MDSLGSSAARRPQPPPAKGFVVAAQLCLITLLRAFPGREHKVSIADSTPTPLRADNQCMFNYERLQFNGDPTPAREVSDLLADHSIELEIVRGHARRRMRPICVPAFLIGRAEDSDLVVGDDRFPDAYAYLLVRGRQLVLRHLGFSPELRVNGEVVTQFPIKDGDAIQAGPYEFRVHIRHLDSSTDGPLPAGGWRPETALAVAQTEALAEALDLLQCIREQVLGDNCGFRLFVGPEEHLANLAALATLPVDSAAFRRGSRPARSA